MEINGNIEQYHPCFAGCADSRKNCAFWAGKGYCKHSFVEFMKRNCKKTCNFCGGSGGGGNGGGAGGGGNGGGGGGGFKILFILSLILSHKWIFARKLKQILRNRAFMGLSSFQSATSLPVPLS